MPLKQITLAKALSMPFAVAQAALINADTNLGPGTAVIDTSTNLEWLKVSATSGLTPDQVFAEMAQSGLSRKLRR